jgi:dTDP-4-amino-4,6-dideoxygalactose transaminase
VSAGVEVPFLDLRAVNDEIGEELGAAIARVVASGSFVLGDEVEAFEREYASFVGSRHCVSVGNGLDALVLALAALGIGPGDEVLVPSHTFVATWLAVSRIGAVPVPVEPDPATYNLDPERLEEAITDRTRAVVPVHLYGQPADLGGIDEVASRHSLAVLEDAAQAHGARHAGVTVGGSGHTAAWSFYPAKNLGALGDGGAVTTDDDAVAERIRLLRNYGSKTKYGHEVRGANSRLDELQAAVLRVKLRHIDDWNERRRKAVDRYLASLDSGIVTLPVVPEWASPAWHLFVVRSERRDELRDHLSGRGVQTLIHYPIPPHLQGAYADLGYGAGSFPIAERLAREVLSLPIGPHITDEHLEHVIAAVQAVEGS